MLISGKPKRLVAQAPLKETTCHAGCGAVVQYRTSPRVICECCRPTWRAEQMRKVAERQRRKRGIEQQKGIEVSCKRCGTSIIKNSLAHVYCTPCAKATMMERSRRVSLALTGVPGARKKHGEYSKRKRHQSAPHAINFRFRAAIRRVLNGGKKGRKWESLVGYTLSDLMVHLERQFLKGMTWDNRGEWEIDHIIPLASFNFSSAEDPEFRAAWALTNLRPMWAGDNRKKNRTRTHLL